MCLYLTSCVATVFVAHSLFLLLFFGAVGLPHLRTPPLKQQQPKNKTKEEYKNPTDCYLGNREKRVSGRDGAVRRTMTSIEWDQNIWELCTTHPSLVRAFGLRDSSHAVAVALRYRWCVYINIYIYISKRRGPSSSSLVVVVAENVHSCRSRPSVSLDPSTNFFFSSPHFLVPYVCQNRRSRGNPEAGPASLLSSRTFYAFMIDTASTGLRPSHVAPESNIPLQSIRHGFCDIIGMCVRVIVCRPPLRWRI